MLAAQELRPSARHASSAVRQRARKCVALKRACAQRAHGRRASALRGGARAPHPQPRRRCSSAAARARRSRSHAAKALALSTASDFVRPEHIHELAVPVLAHRLVLDPQANSPGPGRSAGRRHPARGAGPACEHGCIVSARCASFSALRSLAARAAHRRRLARAGSGGRRSGALGIDTEPDASPTRRSRSWLRCSLLALRSRSRSSAPGLTCARELPRYATAGEPSSYRVGRRTAAPGARGRRCAKRFRDPRPGYEEWRAHARAGRGAPQLVRPHDRLLSLALADRARACRATDRGRRSPRSRPAQRAGVRLRASLPRRRGRIEFAGLTLGAHRSARPGARRLRAVPLRRRA